MKNTESSVQKYKEQSIHYLENAFSFIEAHDAHKAGEFLWGSLAEALKAVAASKGLELRAHWEIGDYARNLAKQLGDKTIYDVLGHASYLHAGFYEAGLKVEEVFMYAFEIRDMVDKLLNLIPSQRSN